MTLTPFETRLYEQLTPFFDDHGFDLLPEKKQYRLTTPTGFQNVLLSPAYYGTETVLDVNFGCRHDQIEQIAQQFLNNLGCLSNYVEGCFLIKLEHGTTTHL